MDLIVKFQKNFSVCQIGHFEIYGKSEFTSLPIVKFATFTIYFTKYF